MKLVMKEVCARHHHSIVRNVGRLRPGAPAGARRFAVRTSIGLATLALARYVPFLAYVMAFIGSLLTVSVSIIFPAACHLSIFQARHAPGVAT